RPARPAGAGAGTGGVWRPGAVAQAPDGRQCPGRARLRAGVRRRAVAGAVAALSVSLHAADAVVECVADVKRAIGCDRDAVRAVELRRPRRAAVTAAANLAVAGDRGDDASRGVHAADRLVLSIDDVEVAGRVDF